METKAIANHCVLLLSLLTLTLAALFSYGCAGAASSYGGAAGVHSVTPSWNASPSVVDYQVYRATGQSGPYALLNSSPIPELQWRDSTVQPGITYYYVITSVAADGTESTYSNQASANIPKP